MNMYQENYVIYDIETESYRIDEYITHLESKLPEKESPNFIRAAQRIFKVSKTIKDPSKIDGAIKKAIEGIRDKAALHWFTGKVTCICAKRFQDGKEFTFFDQDEKKLLNEFLFFLYSDPTYRLVGKSSDFFDLPFLVGRCMYNDLGLVKALRKSDTINDVDHAFSRSSQCSQVSKLDNYAFGLGIDGKSSSGDQASEMNSKDLIDYCKQDVNITHEIFKRWYKPYTVTEQLNF